MGDEDYTRAMFDLPEDIAWVFHNLHKCKGELDEWLIVPDHAPTPGAWMPRQRDDCAQCPKDFHSVVGSVGSNRAKAFSAMLLLDANVAPATKSA